MEKRVLLLTFFAFASVCLSRSDAATPVKVQVSARDLPATDPLNGSPDPYVIISYAYGVSEKFETVGQTAALTDQSNPDWPEIYDFDFVPGTSQRLRFEVWDKDYDSNDLIGDVEFFLAELSNAANRSIEKAIQPPGNGRLIIKNLA